MNANICEEKVIEITNRYGFDDMVFEDMPSMPICPQCHSFKRTNTGQGMACDECQHRDFMEMKHDYDAENL